MVIVFLKKSNWLIDKLKRKYFLSCVLSHFLNYTFKTYEVKRITVFKFNILYFKRVSPIENSKKLIFSFFVLVSKLHRRKPPLLLDFGAAGADTSFVLF